MRNPTEESHPDSKAAALGRASKWYTLAAVVTAFGLVAGAGGVYLQSTGSVWGTVLAGVMVSSIALYGIFRGVAGRCELQAISGVGASAPHRKASLWYTCAAVVTAFGLFFGAVGVYLHSLGSLWGIILSGVMVLSIALYGVFRGVAGHYESRALGASTLL